MNKLQAILEVTLYFTSSYIIALARVLFENRRLWNITLDFKKIPRKRIDKEKFAKLMNRITK